MDEDNNIKQMYANNKGMKELFKFLLDKSSQSVGEDKDIYLANYYSSKLIDLNNEIELSDKEIFKYELNKDNEESRNMKL